MRRKKPESGAQQRKRRKQRGRGSGNIADNLHETSPSAGSTATMWRPRADAMLSDRVQQYLDMNDATYECVEHGRLPKDAHMDPDCHCWDFCTNWNGNGGSAK